MRILDSISDMLKSRSSVQMVADDPQLTTRHVDGPNPVRVVIDPKSALFVTGSELDWSDSEEVAQVKAAARRGSTDAPTKSQGEA